jgi:AraC family transcriptional regulator
MDPVGKAIWFIESHFESEISLDDVAKCAGVSRFHLTRAFGFATGRSVMRYVRGRRLSEAARRLADGAQEILAVAMDSGYGSHEAFTRAFREQFGVTPESVRGNGGLANLELVEAIKLSEAMTKLQPPRIENGKTLLIAGLSQRYNCEAAAQIPAQWGRFGPYLGCVPGQVGSVAYGVCHNCDDAGNFDYICGVEVSDFTGLNGDFVSLRIAEHKYAVFTHSEHISSIRGTWSAIMNEWLPQSGYHPCDTPDFERYDERFDPVSGTGGLEIWIPIQD